MTRESPAVYGLRRFWKDEEGKLICREPDGKLLRGPRALQQFVRCQRKKVRSLERKVLALELARR